MSMNNSMSEESTQRHMAWLKAQPEPKEKATLIDLMIVARRTLQGLKEVEVYRVNKKTR
jgi:hypothetical protein